MVSACKRFLLSLALAVLVANADDSLSTELSFNNESSFGSKPENHSHPSPRDVAAKATEKRRLSTKPAQPKFPPKKTSDKKVIIKAPKLEEDSALSDPPKPRAHGVPLIRELIPTLFFIGASKCATSSLAGGLVLHPGLQGLLDGEASIFTGAIGVKQKYLKLKAAMYEQRKAKAGTIIMDYTPHYIFETQHVPHDLCAALNKAGSQCQDRKYLIVLRDPVERTLSSWMFKSTTSDEHRSLDKVIKEGAQLAADMTKCWEAVLNSKSGHGSVLMAAQKCPADLLLSPAPHNSHAKIALSHVGKSLYYYQLQGWWNIIPEKQFKVLLIEKYFKDPLTHFQKILRWLDLEPVGEKGFASQRDMFSAATRRVNVKKKDKRLLKQVTSEAKGTLAAIFAPHNKLLDNLLGYKTGYCVQHCFNGHIGLAVSESNTGSFDEEVSKKAPRYTQLQKRIDEAERSPGLWSSLLQWLTPSFKSADASKREQQEKTTATTTKGAQMAIIPPDEDLIEAVQDSGSQVCSLQTCCHGSVSSDCCGVFRANAPVCCYYMNMCPPEVFSVYNQ